jgi:hypothetical protein
VLTRRGLSSERLDAAVLLDTPIVEVVHVGCCWPRSEAGDEEWNQSPQIVIPRRGLFMIHRYEEHVLADPTRAIVFGPEEGYRVSHPLDDGDEYLVLTFEAEIHDQAVVGYTPGLAVCLRALSSLPGSSSPASIVTTLTRSPARRSDAPA